jgi:hypothetical protein
MVLLPIHIAAGALAIIAGAVALYAAKGAALHRRSGMLFVYAMLVMSATAAVLASLQPNWMDALQGVLTFYLVTTGVLTVRRRGGGSRSVDRAALLVALSVGAVQMTFGFQALQSATGKRFGYPPALFFIFGSLALLAAAGDVRMIRAGRLDGARRIARHLWRMSFAMFIATGSFFLGQAKVIPKPIRIMPLLIVLAVAPLVLMIFWLVRVRFKRGVTPAFRRGAIG